MTSSSLTPAVPLTLDGVLNVAKPHGWTSHDVVEKIRRSLGLRKVGHAGTLDPMATGVLPILLGKGTRVSEYLVEWDKEYEAVLRLGQDTDTQDADGTVIRERSVEGITEDMIRAVAQEFLGPQQQMPPMYSALKVGGRRLYKMARAGQTVERPPRAITIHALEVLRVQIPDVVLRVVCSKGTYIRTLCADIGQGLGVGGHLHQLCRTRVGPFFLKEALAPNDVTEELGWQEQKRVLWSLDAVLNHLPEVVIASSMEIRALNGAPIPRHEVSSVSLNGSGVDNRQGVVRVKSSTGQLLGLGKFEGMQYNSEEEKPLVFVKVFKTKIDA